MKNIKPRHTTFQNVFYLLVIMSLVLSCQQPSLKDAGSKLPNLNESGPIPFFVAAGIVPDWKLSLSEAVDSTFSASILLPDQTTAFEGRIIPVTNYPAGSDRPNDIYHGSVSNGHNDYPITIKLVADGCGGKPYSGMKNTGCLVFCGTDTLSGCGRWLREREPDNLQ